MTTLYACGFNAHGQISPFKLGLQRTVTDYKISEEAAGQENENEIESEDVDGKDAAEVLEVQDDVLSLQKVCAAGGGLDGDGGDKGAVRVVFAGWSESAGAF